jgi:hypothetical protein
MPPPIDSGALDSKEIGFEINERCNDNDPEH